MVNPAPQVLLSSNMDLRIDTASLSAGFPQLLLPRNVLSCVGLSGCILVWLQHHSRFLQLFKEELNDLLQ